METEDTRIIDAEYTEISVEPVTNFSEINEETVKKLHPILQRFMDSYAAKPKDMTDETWLAQKLGEELPEKSSEEIAAMSREIVASVEEFDRNLTSLNKACETGTPKEVWLADKLQNAAVGVNVVDYGNYLQGIDDTLRANNEAMMNVIHRADGNINMNPNLDGFIAEQEVVNSFNREAALKNSPYRAEALQPDGKTYAKNSVDVVIRDTRKSVHNIVKRYQLKFGKNAEATAQYLEHGDYRGQQSIVPKGQKQGVRENVSPAKQVNDYIESPDGVRSKPLSKEQAKRHQERVQEGQNLRQDTWNSYNTRELAINIGKQAAVAGMAGAAMGAGFHLAAKVFQGEEIKASEVVEVALKTGATTGITCAAAGALKVGVEKGLVPVLAKGTPIGVLTTIVSIGIENVKIMKKFVDGEIGGIKAIDLMARTTTAVVGGIAAAAEGAAIGAAALSFIPIAGTLVGGIIGGTIGYMAGSKVGNAIYSGVKKIAGVAKTAVKAAWSGVKSVASTAWSGVKSVASGVGSFVKGLFS